MITNEEKAQRLQDMALIPVFLNRQDEALLREAAAHLRSLVPDKNGLLPCPMCGPHGKPATTGTFQGDFNVICKTCSLRTVYHMEKADAIAAWNRRGGVQCG